MDFGALAVVKEGYNSLPVKGRKRKGANVRLLYATSLGMGLVINKAAVESFFSSLKKEKTRRYIFKTREQARAEIFDYIEVFYNRARRHRHIGNISLQAYEEQMALIGWVSTGTE